MKLHRDARTCPESRKLLVERIESKEWSPAAPPSSRVQRSCKRMARLGRRGAGDPARMRTGRRGAPARQHGSTARTLSRTARGRRSRAWPAGPRPAACAPLGGLSSPAPTPLSLQVEHVSAFCARCLIATPCREFWGFRARERHFWPKKRHLRAARLCSERGVTPASSAAATPLRTGSERPHIGRNAYT
jgi:hypothetical protein